MSLLRIFQATFILLTILSNTALSAPTVKTNFEAIDYYYEFGCNKTESKLLCPDISVNCCCKGDWSTLFNLVDGLDPFYQYNNYIVVCTGWVDEKISLPDETETLFFRRTTIPIIHKTLFSNRSMPQIRYFEIREDHTLVTVEKNAFSLMVQVKDIIFFNVKHLEYIAESAFSDLPFLQTLKFFHSGLKMVQGITGISNIPGEAITISMIHNDFLTKVPKHSFLDKNSRIVEIQVYFNPSLKIVEDYAFNSSSVVKIVLRDNRALEELSEFAFAGCDALHFLSIQNTPIRSLPTVGLSNLQILNARKVPNMIHFPKKEKLPKLRIADLTYSYHCCTINEKYGFKETYKERKDLCKERIAVDCDTGKKIHCSSNWGQGYAGHKQKKTFEQIIINNGNPIDLDFDNETGVYSLPEFSDEDFVHLSSSVLPMNTDYATYDRLLSSEEGHWHSGAFSEEELGKQKSICYLDENGVPERILERTPIRCTPEPDAFKPCEDLLGHDVLKVFSWIVASLSLSGNFVVIATMLFIAFCRTHAQQSNMTVSKFLILNLSLADMFMGIYICSLAITNQKTKGNYYWYGVNRQSLGECNVIGFFAIFSSELSILVLTVISLERWYAIRYAIELTRRMSMKFAFIVMTIAWFVAGLLALLPLVGVNSYTKTAICLPFDTDHSSEIAYLVFLLAMNIVAFVVMTFSYISMFIMTRSSKKKPKESCLNIFRKTSNTTNEDQQKNIKKKRAKNPSVGNKNSDASVARRMAVLVFTDFACLFPICFFSLLAVAGLSLISVSESKILLVIFFPLNSCCNPFLYAVLTKSFRKDVLFVFTSLKQCRLFTRDERKRLPPEKNKTKKTDATKQSPGIQIQTQDQVEIKNGEEAGRKSFSQKSPNKGEEVATSTDFAKLQREKNKKKVKTSNKKTNTLNTPSNQRIPERSASSSKQINSDTTGPPRDQHENKNDLKINARTDQASDLDKNDNDENQVKEARTKINELIRIPEVSEHSDVNA